jgi:hypothetical protein
MVWMMLWMMLRGGCQTIGSGGRLPMPGTLSVQKAELKDINGRLYDHLQILLWVGRNNYGGDQRDNWQPGNGKPEMVNRKRRNGRPRKGKSSNREIGMKALDGCMEIVGLPDGNEMLLANNIDGEGVERLVREAMVLKARKEKLVGRMGKDTALLEKMCASYESSHRTLRTLQVFGGLACAVIVVLGLIFFRLR